jgi:ADP-ribosylation factor-like protein 8
VLDSADLGKIDSAKHELWALLERPELAAVPVLVLGNKSDLPESLKVTELIDRL